MVDLTRTPDQEQIVDAAVTFLAKRLPLERLHRSADARRGEDAALWAELGELGWLGLSAPEEHGGSGLSLVEEALLFREFGRVLAPPTVVAASLAARLAGDGGRADLAHDIITGSIRLGLAIAAGTPDLTQPLSAVLHLVDAIDTPLVLLWTASGAALYERAALGAATAVAPLDETLSLETVEVRDVRPLVAVAGPALPLIGDLLVAGLLCGIAEAARDVAVGYAKVREQFGRPIGSFQAVKHRCADMAIKAEAASAQLSFAAIVASNGTDDARHQVHANARACIQLHGGMGFTADCVAHHFLKRTHALARLGGAGQWRTMIGGGD